jgi:hypothetical protein
MFSGPGQGEARAALSSIERGLPVRYSQSAQQYDRRALAGAATDPEPQRRRSERRAGGLVVFLEAIQILSPRPARRLAVRVRIAATCPGCASAEPSRRSSRLRLRVPLPAWIILYCLTRSTQQYH